ncbi:GNAT family N-acetyltransferase [uncultured Rothia sp.]|uniref:GNAT family N-acetyltransferase n=1 Tax=uncultured Rothia sp. TaxID=316088 RepID=UPI003217F98A
MFSLFQRVSADVLIRPLTTDDWADLEKMINTDPITFLYASEHLELFGLPAPSALPALRYSAGFMGIFTSAQPSSVAKDDEGVTRVANPGVDTSPQTTLRNVSPRLRQVAEAFLTPLTQLRKSADSVSTVTAENTVSFHTTAPPELVGAFWLGSNCVPLVIPEEYRVQVAAVIARSSRTVASIFGAHDEVMGLWDLLAPKTGKPLSVRENQPLLYLPQEVGLDHLTARSLHRAELKAPQLIAGGVRWARTSDRKSLLRASVAMFTEEVGYDPMERDPVGYAKRVDNFIRTGRSVVAVNEDSVVVFKADLGLVHSDICQIQGVWLHPAYRGFGLSEPLLAQGFQLIRARFPHITLYVNDFNTRARKLYEALGMEQRGTFSTILF